MEGIVVIIVVVFILLVIVFSSLKKTDGASTSSNQSDLEALEEKKERIRLEMVEIGVKALTSIEMSDSEKLSLLSDAKQFFIENFTDNYLDSFEEIASNAFKYEIDNFKNDNDLRLKISERYQKFLNAQNKKSDKDFAFQDLITFSSYYRDNHNAESQQYKMNELRLEMIRISAESLVSLELSLDEKESMFETFQNDVREFFPNRITECYEDLATRCYQYEIDHFTIDKSLNENIKHRYTEFKKAKRPITFSDYGFEDIQDFASQYKAFNS